MDKLKQKLMTIWKADINTGIRIEVVIQKLGIEPRVLKASVELSIRSEIWAETGGNRVICGISHVKLVVLTSHIVLKMWESLSWEWQYENFIIDQDIT